MKGQKSREVILKVITRQDVRVFYFTSLCLPLLICEVGIIYSLYGVDVKISSVRRGKILSQRWAHRKCCRSLCSYSSNAPTQMLPVSECLSVPQRGLLSPCSIAVYLSLCFGTSVPLPMFRLLSAYSLTSLPFGITNPMKSGIY